MKYLFFVVIFYQTAEAKNIIWSRPDGGVSVTICAEGVDPEKEATRLKAIGNIPQEYEVAAVNESIPVRDEFRDAWTLDGKKIVHDLEKAKKIKAEKIKEEVDRSLIQVDAELPKAQASGKQEDMDAWRAKRVKLESMTMQAEIDAAKSVEDLKAIKLPK